jgi:WhiB family redox-sensing transcriptional regulator
MDRLAAHRFYTYRGCAPHWDNPKVIAANETLELSAFHGPDGGETQKERIAREAAALAVCGSCPLTEACREYAIGDGPSLREPRGIWGATTAHNRRTILAERLAALQQTTPEPLPLVRLRTRQKQGVLAALAAHEDLAKQCAEAGLDARTVLWQISRLATLLRLPPGDRDRTHILAAAAAAGVLPDTAPAPAAAPEVALEHQAVPKQQTVRPSRPPIRLLSPLRCEIPGQLALDLGPAGQPRLRIITPRRPHHRPAATLLTLNLLEAAA